MKVSTITILIFLTSSWGFSQSTEKHQLDLRDYQRIEFKDKITGTVIPFLQPKPAPITKRPRALETQDESVHEWYYLERVGQLPWYYDMVCGDANHDGLNEFMVGSDGANYINKIWSSDGDNSYRVEFINIQPGEFGDRSDIEIGNCWGQDSQIVICSNNSLSIVRSNGINQWQRALKFDTGSGSAKAKAFNPTTNTNTVILNTVFSPLSITWIYKIKGTYIQGDVNNDARVSGSDVLYLVAVLKNGSRIVPEPYWRADANGDCEVGWADVSSLVSYLKGLGPVPEPGWCNLFIVGN